MIDLNAAWQCFLNSAGQAAMTCSVLLKALYGIAAWVSLYGEKSQCLKRA